MMDTGFRRYDGTIIDAADLDCIASKLRQAFGDRLYGVIARHRCEEEAASKRIGALA